MHLAITVARFFLRELHDEVKSAKCWSETVRVTPQLKRDLECVDARPGLQGPIENAYLHCDLSGYEWGAVLNDCVEARGFWGMSYIEELITFEELKAMRCAI